MNERIYSCPVALKLKGRTAFVLWVEPPKGENYLFKHSGLIFIARSETELRRRAKTSRAPKVMWKWKSRIDLDAFVKQAARLKAGSFSKPPTCKTLLDGWNFLEDIARTVNAPKNLRIYTKKGPIFKMYDKLFHGNNLRPVTPEGKEYWPIWTEAELRAFRPALRELTNLLNDRAPELYAAS